MSQGFESLADEWVSGRFEIDHLLCVGSHPRQVAFTHPEFKLRANSSSPLKWTAIVVEEALSPLERTFAMSQGFKSLADEWVSGRFEIDHLLCVGSHPRQVALSRPEFKLRANSSSPLKWTAIVVEEALSPLEKTFAMSQGFESLADEWVSGRFESNKSLLETERRARVLPPPSLAPDGVGGLGF